MPTPPVKSRSSTIASAGGSLLLIGKLLGHRQASTTQRYAHLFDDPVRRTNFLNRLGGVEHTAFLKFNGETVKGVPEEDQDRTNEQGKASSVQFIHFPLTEPQAAAFKQAGQQIILGFDHPAYGHMAVLSEETRAALAGDLD